MTRPASGQQHADQISPPPVEGNSPSGGPDIELAKLAARVHCPIRWPEGAQCNNCQAPFPCMIYRWAYALLERAGWSDTQILALDTRVGPWF